MNPSRTIPILILALLLVSASPAWANSSYTETCNFTGTGITQAVINQAVQLENGALAGYGISCSAGTNSISCSGSFPASLGVCQSFASSVVVPGATCSVSCSGGASDPYAFGGGVNGFGSFNLQAGETGHASFTKHYSDDQPNWQREQEKKKVIFTTLTHGVTSPATIKFQHLYYRKLMLRCPVDGCNRTKTLVSTQPGKGKVKKDSKAAAEDQASDGSTTGAATGGSAGAPTGGSSGTDAKAGTEQAPKPVPAEEDKYCQKGWWLNSETRNCYSQRKDCLLDGTSASRSCRLSLKK